MELYKEILIEALSKQKMEVHFPDLAEPPAEIVEGVCCRALECIRDILRDNTLSDESCFLRIEEVLQVLEELGSDGGSRHDFG